MGSMVMTENFQPAEWLLASQGVCSMKSVISTNTELQLHSTSQLIKSFHELNIRIEFLKPVRHLLNVTYSMCARAVPHNSRAIS
jgi:hypothetical protein